MRITLETEHNRIQALCSRVVGLLRSSEQPNFLFLTPVRDEVSAMLTQHMRFKEAMIYGPLKQSARPAKLSTIGQMDSLCSTLYADYRAHRAEWPSDRIVSEWAAYRAETLDLVERLDRAIQLERAHIYPLLGVGCTEFGQAA
jgi:hypothetical protein